MHDDEIRFERRPMQRFVLTLPVSVRLAGAARESSGYTQDLSARGVMFFADLPLAESDLVELTFTMPSVITLAEAMRVRCRGRVVRVAPPSGGTARGVAVRIDGYEFLAEPESLTHGSESFVTARPADFVSARKVRTAVDSLHPASPVLP